MLRRTTLMLALVSLTIAGLPGVAAAGDHDDGGHDLDDGEAIYLSLGDSLAMGSLADASGTTIFPSKRSYTDRLHKILVREVDDDIRHVKLGCDGYKTTDMMVDPADDKCDYVTGTQLGDALMWLQTGDVALVTITVGANDINHLAGACGFNPVCIEAGIPAILGNVWVIVYQLRATGYSGPIVGTEYYNPNVTASIGYFPGAPGPLAPDPLFAGFTDQLVRAFNGGLASVYGLFGAPTADIYAAFSSGDFDDDGGRFQIEGNAIPDNTDLACDLTFMCPDEFGPSANHHPTPNGYRVMANSFWDVIEPMDIEA